MVVFDLLGLVTVYIEIVDGLAPLRADSITHILTSYDELDGLLNFRHLPHFSMPVQR